VIGDLSGAAEKIHLWALQRQHLGHVPFRKVFSGAAIESRSRQLEHFGELFLGQAGNRVLFYILRRLLNSSWSSSPFEVGATREKNYWFVVHNDANPTS